ncbi:hypothetical protein [Halomonas sp. CKK8]|uniref:hypothetical protein n=1 Tax=Halomonas sp. CKK8 TaxID=3036127 RepID=UPI00241567D6|nr:hypothetical protein [Halomonas sp. CKK8]WFM72783.1 hypothetical protein P8934_07260 [Halomonas sp. CKK8]
MRRKPIVAVLSCAALVAGGYLFNNRRMRKKAPIRQRCSMMQRMLAAMPEDSPPKVISSVMPRLQEQNEEILALLREQNQLLRASQRSE